MNTEWHFPIMIAVSTAVFVGILRIVLGAKLFRARLAAVIVVAIIVNVGGMLFGKYGALAGLPWWIYYTVPALVTLVLAPIVFRMGWKRALLYVILAFASAPVIHVFFSALFGWTEYMPFIPVPQLTGTTMSSLVPTPPMGGLQALPGE